MNATSRINDFINKITNWENSKRYERVLCYTVGNCTFTGARLSRREGNLQRVKLLVEDRVSGPVIIREKVRWSDFEPLASLFYTGIYKQQGFPATTDGQQNMSPQAIG